MWRACIVLACSALASACVEDHLVACANGVACPAGLVCDEPHKTCVTHAQATACAFLEDNTTCLEDGACHHGICVPIRCGNWLRDPLEMCDDGNTASGDGCSADCSTNERCGNGVIDPEQGEACDEGDLGSHDGCDSRCQLEVLGFTQLTQRSAPARQSAAYAFDEARGKLVIFGGQTFDFVIGDTLEWDATSATFSVRRPDFAPAARTGGSAAYDAKHHVVVMFGGSDASGSGSDTWTWDGERWRLMTTPIAPAFRSYAGMTYDSRRGRVVLFGGAGANGLRDDTWAWDGTTWTEIHSTLRPPPRAGMMFAYDPAHDRGVLFGGKGTTTLGDMWILEGDEWSQISPPGLPPARAGGTLTFDPEHGGLVMVGGGSASSTELWDGNQWTQIGTTLVPPRTNGVAYFDPAIRTTVVGLGVDSADRGDMQRLDGEVWTDITQSDGPLALTDAAVAYDARRGRVVMFGGLRDLVTSSQETWEHDGSVWIRQAPQAPPPARAGAAMAYDERRGKMVMWGGTSSDPDVHEWDGFTWTAIVASGPPVRAHARMAYDPASRTIVMFGGAIGSAARGDTWQWDGATWTEVTTSPSPPERSRHGLTYDRERGQIVLFGGVSSGPKLGDTWTWTASGGWREEQPLSSPSARRSFVLATDPVRGEVVLFGGLVNGTSGFDEPVRDVWRWDGATWTRVFAMSPPQPHGEAAAAFDLARRHLLIHGPQGTWRLQWRGPTSDEACRTAIDRDDDDLRGCGDPDCAAFCAPLCPIGQSCAGPVCGDGMCSPLESCRLCERDCGFCPPRCGDGYCDGGETCPGECPS